jgi:hypothetical protein
MKVSLVTLCWRLKSRRKRSHSSLLNGAAGNSTCGTLAPAPAAAGPAAAEAMVAMTAANSGTLGSNSSAGFFFFYCCGSAGLCPGTDPPFLKPAAPQLLLLPASCGCAAGTNAISLRAAAKLSTVLKGLEYCLLCDQCALTKSKAMSLS